MAEEAAFNPAVLEGYYSRDSEIDFSWMKKSTQHQFRWRGLNNRWHSSPRRVRDANTLAKAFGKSIPTDVYVSTASWLNPVDLPRLHDTESSAPVLLDHWVVFDIDVPPFSQTTMEVARMHTVRLHEWMKQKSDYAFSHVTFSGSKGFHLFYHDLQREKFQIADLRIREETVRASRKELLEQVVQAGHPVDTKITADIRRIIRLPGSVHGKTGWICSILTLEQLQQPFKKWMNSLKRHDAAIGMPKKSKSKKSFFTRVKKPSNIEPEKYASIEVSTHVPGTKNRSAFLEWLPKNWGEPQEAVKKALEFCTLYSLGATAFWTDGERTLMLTPRAIPREQLVKIAKKNGFLNLKKEVEKMDHAWIRISGEFGEHSGWGGDLIPINVLAQETNSDCNWPWSQAHLQLAENMGLPIQKDDTEGSGNEQPSIRIVQRK